MLKYKASDIVKRAKEIADLKGTDFVSYSENISLLNECWTEIYNKLINSNDKTFLKQIELTEGENELPEDFYIIEAITVNGQPITKFTIGMFPSQQYYEIINNKLVLNNIKCAKLYYYPAPDTITLKQDMYTTDLSNDLTVPYYYEPITGNCYISSSNGYYIINKSDNFSTATLVDKDNYPELYNKLIIIDDSGTKHYFDTNKRYTTTIDDIELSFEFTSGNMVLIHWEDNWYDVSSVTPRKILIENLSAYINTHDSNLATNLTDDDEIVYPLEDGHIFKATFDAFYLDDIELAKNTSNNDKLKIQNGFCYDVNFETGYGAFLNQVNTIYGVLPDTELNFPNNIYYTLLSYKLAYAYACKQSKDTTFIQAQLQDAWQIFYNSKERDGFGNRCIINTYSGGY